MDQQLYKRLEKIEEQIELLKTAEENFLKLDAHKRVLAAQLFVLSTGKNVAEREAAVFSSKDWIDFSKGHAQAETLFNHERRRYELRLKAYDAEHLSYKIDGASLMRQTHG